MLQSGANWKGALTRIQWVGTQIGTLEAQEENGEASRRNPSATNPGFSAFNHNDTR